MSARPPARAAPELPSISTDRCLAQAWQAPELSIRAVCVVTLFPTLHLKAEGAFFRTLKWLSQMPPAAAQPWLERQTKQWFSQIGVLGPGQARV